MPDPRDNPQSPLRRLSLDSLRDLDFGRASEQFQAELTHVVKDCMDRPLDDRKRSVTIKFNISPKAPDPGSQSADCTICEVDAEISAKVPDRRTRIYDMGVKRDASLVFRVDSTDDPLTPRLFDPADEDDTNNQ